MHQQYEQYIQEPHLNVSEVHNDYSSYNIGPTKRAPVYRIAKDGNGVLEYMSWGLVPTWTKRPNEFTQYKTFNARKEAIIEGSKLWASVSKFHRCVIPVEGYYEWQQRSIGTTKRIEKVPYYIKRKDGKVMFLAGLWSKTILENEDKFESYTVVTGPAPEKMEWLHHRMPIVLEPGSKEWEQWLGKNGHWDKEIAQVALDVHDHDELEWYQVTKDVGKMSNDGPQLVKPVKKGGITAFFKNNVVKEEEQNVLNHNEKTPKVKVKEEEGTDHDDERKVEGPKTDNKRPSESIAERIHSKKHKVK